MLVALALLTLQNQEPGPIVLPPGSSQDFQSMVHAVQAAVDGGDWAEAKRLADRLPSNEVTIQWDETGLNAEQKVFFAQARDAAMLIWKDSIQELQVKLAPKGKIKVGFVETLPPNADSPGPAGAVFLYSPASEDPVVEGVWALLRGNERRPIDRMEVKNETHFAIGSFLGMARQVRIGHLLFRSEEPYIEDNKFTAGDARLARKNIEISDRIRRDVAAKKNPQVAAPQIVLNPDKFTPRPVGQAEEMMVSLQIANQGKGTLDYRLVPDCGCFVLGVHKQQLAPGETTVVPIIINTLDFTGKLNKALFVYSNDPDFPIKRIPLETIVRPAYRFIDQMKEPSLIVDDNGAVFETILLLDESKSFQITGVNVSGVSGRAEVDPKMWEGVIGFPETGEEPRLRKGYRIRVLIAPGLPPGRLGLQLEVKTDDKLHFASLYHSVNVQKGIVAVPLSIYFGQISNQPARASVVLTRPGRPYKVTKVESDTEFVKASVEPYRGETEYKIVATFTGKAPLGRFFGKIKVHTDDPKQPVIELAFEGTVK